MLIDQELVLRPLQKSDLEFFQAWRNDMEYIRDAQSIRFPKHEMLEEQWLEHVSMDISNRQVVFMMTLEGKPIGFVQFSAINWISRRAMLGIVIGDPGQRGKGIGRRAMKLLVDYGFGKLNLHKISLEVTASNTAAVALYEKLGFQTEGTFREHYYWAEEFHDVYYMSLIRS